MHTYLFARPSLTYIVERNYRIWHSPHNPTGKVFTKDELEVIAEACRKMDCLAITDEVWTVNIPLLYIFQYKHPNKIIRCSVSLTSNQFLFMFSFLSFHLQIWFLELSIYEVQVYEYITYDMGKHISIASLPGMQERTIVTSSMSKTFSVTGMILSFFLIYSLSDQYFMLWKCAVYSCCHFNILHFPTV